MTPKFNYVVCSIEESKNIDLLSLDELQASLLVHEKKITQQDKEEQALLASSNIYKKGGRGRGRGRQNNEGRGSQHHQSHDDRSFIFRGTGRGRGRSRGGQQSKVDHTRSVDKSNVECYRCHKYGHYQNECRTNLTKDSGEKSNFAETEEEISLLMDNVKFGNNTKISLGLVAEAKMTTNRMFPLYLDNVSQICLSTRLKNFWEWNKKNIEQTIPADLEEDEEQPVRITEQQYLNPDEPTSDSATAINQHPQRIRRRPAWMADYETWEVELVAIIIFVELAVLGNHFVDAQMGINCWIQMMNMGIVGLILLRLKIHSNNDVVETNVQIFSYKELEEATNRFKEEIGRGSFGIVYKGLVKNGSRTVAVKKLDRVAQDTEKEFRAEVKSIGQTHHKNLVRLLGFCDEGQHRLLVYEYMSNGTLSSLIFGNSKPSWGLRTQIAVAIARGLAYLHEECSNQIIHCDIKPQNILLDEYYNARISDFGLAKLLAFNQSRTHTNIRGTKGYVAPEWFRSSQVTSKVDVYSFGVMLLEIISCRRCVGEAEIEEGENPILNHWVWDCFQQGRLDRLVEDDFEALNDMKKLERYVKVGIWCIQEDSSLRPIMRKVCQMLEGVVEVLKPPSPSPFSS
ncbi:hypothetical protein M9H77_06173 [Catharanthus roseus]|uniref:Uncharacterized protein n=1 Tax=Catharanthus roseus TaxID=4058 RepID=A0ACC0BRR3_CATRO|nr:hypothetical protein M9H77_06173 [Catharanthus roseus]